MTATINVRLYGPTEVKSSGVTLTKNHPFGGIHDADELGDGQLVMYLDLNRPEGVEDGSSIDIYGTLADFGELIDAMAMAVANLVEANPNLPFEGPEEVPA